MRKPSNKLELVDLSPKSGESSAATLPVKTVESAKSKNSNAPSDASPASVDEALEQFGEYKQAMTEMMEKAAKLVCYIIDHSDDGYGKLLTRYPDMTRRSIGNLERVGRGRLLPALAMDPSLGARFVSKFPLKEQQRLMDTSLTVIRQNEEGFERVAKTFAQLTPTECARVFRDDRLATDDEQKEWFKTQSATTAMMPAYQVNHETGTIHFNATDFSLMQLEAIVESAKQEQIKRLAHRVNTKLG